jgi:hypothetical protein
MPPRPVEAITGRAIIVDVHARTGRRQLAVASTKRVAPAAACLIRSAASDESEAVAPDSRIAGNAPVLHPAGWLISRRLGSGRRIAVRIRAGLAFPGGLCDGPGATRFPRAGLAFMLGRPRSGSRGPADGARTAAGAAPLGLSPAEQPRLAADIWQAVRKEATPCGTSTEGESGPIS